MAENKKKVIVYANWKSTFDKLSDEEAGRLIKHFFAYINDEDPDAPDRITELVFENIKTALKSDLEKWEQAKFGKSNSGKLGNLKRWNPDVYDRLMADEITLDQAIEIAKDRKSSQPDNIDGKESQDVANIAVIDNAIVIDNVLLEKKTKHVDVEVLTPPKKPRRSTKQFVPPTKDEVVSYFVEKGYKPEIGAKAFDYYHVADWHDSGGKKVVNWKQKIQANWFKDEHKAPEKQSGNYWEAIITAPVGSKERRYQIVEAFKDVPQDRIPHEFREVFNVYSQIL